MSRRLVLLAALVAANACDPCAGVVGCTVPAHVGASGRVLDETSGAPAAGIAIDFVRTGGVALESDSLRTTTDGDGQFDFDVGAQTSGIVTGYIRLQPSGATSYRVTGLNLPTSYRRGEMRTFGPWSTVPHAPDYVGLYIRGAPAVVATSVRVDFHRTGGVAVGGLSNDTYSASTDANGFLPLFGDGVRPQDAGDIIGDLTVYMPPPIGAVVRNDLHVPATANFRAVLPVHLLGVGPSLEYHIATFRRGLSEPVSGTKVEFHRTGGVDVEPPDWISHTDASGRVAFPVRARGSGVLTGDVTITPPASWKSFERKGLSFPTFESDSARLYDVIEVGPGVTVYAVVRAQGKALKGVRVEYRRVGGLETRPGSFTFVSNDSGYTLLTAATDVEGDVVADLTIRPPSPYRSFVVRGVHMPAKDGDVPKPPFIVGTWDVASP